VSAGNNNPLAVGKTVYQAVDRDRALMESMVDEDFHFTSPLWPRRRCWHRSAGGCRLGAL